MSPYQALETRTTGREHPRADPRRPEPFLERYGREILLPSEENFHAVLEKIDCAFRWLSRQPQERSGRRAVELFSYEEEADGYRVPRVGLGFEEALGESLEAFEGCIRWHDPSAMFNLTPSPLLDTVALSTLTSLYNPNALWDMTGGKFLLLERKVTRALAALAGWDTRRSGGFFTSGGKATLMYAIKAGLNACDRSTIERGLRDDHVVLASGSGHYSIESICNVLGIGRRNCIRVPTTAGATIDPVALRDRLHECIASGRKVACVVLNGGSTVDLCIDPTSAVREIVEDAAERFGLDYRPHVHLDAVISWAWLFLAVDRESYADRVVSEAVREKIARATSRIVQVADADSFGADFHKTGLCPYVSSCYLARSEQSLLSLTEAQPEEEEHLFGDVRPFTATFENSRGCAGIISAFHVLQRLGVDGFQAYLVSLLETSEKLKAILREEFADRFEVLNHRSDGFEVVVKIHLFGDVRPFQELFSLPAAARAEHDRVCAEFFRFLCHDPYCRAADAPFIGFVPRYRLWERSDTAAAFLLYSRSPHADRRELGRIVARLADAAGAFEARPRQPGAGPERACDGLAKVPPR